MSEQTRWVSAHGAGHAKWYIERFRQMAAQGADLAGEARLLDAMLARGSRVLDAGCGPGRVGAELAARGHVVVGVDVDQELVDAPEVDQPGPTWLQGDLAELDLASRGVPGLGKLGNSEAHQHQEHGDLDVVGVADRQSSASLGEEDVEARAGGQRRSHPGETVTGGGRSHDDEHQTQRTGRGGDALSQRSESGAAQQGATTAAAMTGARCVPIQPVSMSPSKHCRSMWLLAQPMFFVATAPMAEDGHVNLSPKGRDGTFAVLGPRQVGYLDYFGSGSETIAHLRENGRITVMFSAFDGRPTSCGCAAVGASSGPQTPSSTSSVAGSARNALSGSARSS